MIPSSNHAYFLVHKPKGMLSQFKGDVELPMLGDLEFSFPEGTHAVGRLDKDSEGLLLLTTNKKVTRLLFEGPEQHERAYLVMVKNYVTTKTIETLRKGVQFKTFEGKDYVTAPCIVDLVHDPLTEFGISDEYRCDIPHSWLLMKITEGKYHQVRKMVAAVHHRCRRLIRVSIENIQLDDMQPGEVRQIEEQLFFNQLNIFEDWTIN
jgi:23S rRNA pseudouridine2457 synthase